MGSRPPQSGDPRFLTSALGQSALGSGCGGGGNGPSSRTESASRECFSIAVKQRATTVNARGGRLCKPAPRERRSGRPWSEPWLKFHLPAAPPRPQAPQAPPARGLARTRSCLDFLGPRTPLCTCSIWMWKGRLSPPSPSARHLHVPTVHAAMHSRLSSRFARAFAAGRTRLALACRPPWGVPCV